MPPSISSDWPVMNDDSSEARNSAPLAISIGLAEATHRDVHEAALALGVVGQELGEQRREHRARAQGVGPDALAGVDHGDLAGHRQHRALRRRVGDLRRGGTQVGDEGGDVDDAAAARLEHRRDAVPAAAGDAGDVDVEHVLPRGVAGVRRAVVVAGRDAGVVVEHVEAAERRRRRGRPRRATLSSSPTSSATDVGLAAGGLDRRRPSALPSARSATTTLGALARRTARRRPGRVRPPSR